MTGSTFLGGRLVEENGLAGDQPGQFVTVGAADIAMNSVQGEFGPLVMVEERGFPFQAVVAFHTMSDSGFGKLLPVRTLVAVFTDGGRSFEIHIDEPGFEVGRFVAIDAGGGAMGSQQRKRRLGMIEARQLLPRPGGVAGFASRGGATGPGLQHPLLELALMRVGVATGAREALPVVDHTGLPLKLRGFLVAVTAGHCDVASGKREMGVFVPRQGEG